MSVEIPIFVNKRARTPEQDATVGKRVGILIAFGLFATPYLLRHKLIPGSEAIWAINPVAFLTVAWLLLYMLGHKYQISRRVSVAGLVLFAALTATALSNGMSVSFVISCLLPLALLLVVVPETIFPSLFEGFLRVLNVAMLVIAACAVFDLASGFAVSRAIGAFYGSESLASMNSSGRLVSILGHSLLTAEVALFYYALNQMANKVMGFKVNQILVTLVAVGVVLLTGSRSAMMSLVCMIVLTYSNPNNIKYCIVIIAGFLAFYLAGMFDTMIDRIQTGIQSGDMTSSRNTKLDELLAAGVIRYEWFAGHEFNYANASLIIALEYPLLRFAFSYGIAFSVLLAAYLFVLPAVRIFSQLGVVPCGLLILYLVHVNTYSSICTTQDGMLQCVVVVWLFVGVARYATYRNTCGLRERDQ